MSAPNLAGVSVPLNFQGSPSHQSNMPWFRKAQKSKRKLKISKKDISEPSDFKHCYHAVLDTKNEEFSGLPPQWAAIVEEEKTLSGPHEPVENSSQAKKPASSPPKTRQAEEKRAESVEEHSPISEDEFSDTTSGHLTEFNTKNLRSSNSKYSIASSNSTLSLSKRPSPIIRGSDTSLEDTIKFIRRHCQNRSNESFGDTAERLPERPSSSKNSHSVEKDAHMTTRGRMYSQSRTGSFMQLRSSPVNRKHVVSLTSSSTSAMTQQGGSEQPTSAFCLSAPSEVIQSDLGLYSNNTTRTDVGSVLSSHGRINSPSESSGYFGSNGSSLCNSRMSSAQQISSTAMTTPTSSFPASSAFTQQPHHAHSHHFTKALDTYDETDPYNTQHTHTSDYPPPPSSSAVQQSAHYHNHHQRFYSLQRRPDLSTATGSGHHAPSHPRHPYTSAYHGAVQRGASVNHYGTAPRAHRNVHSTYSSGTANAETEGVYRIHEYATPSAATAERDSQQLLHQKRLNHRYENIPPYPGTAAGLYSGNAGSAGLYKKEKRNSRMNFEQFRTTLELLVNPADPRSEYVDFVKIGEGSTGNVYTARHVSSNQIVAVKKMNILKQQRRELLFNEVSDCVCLHCMGLGSLGALVMYYCFISALHLAYLLRVHGVRYEYSVNPAIVLYRATFYP